MVPGNFFEAPFEVAPGFINDRFRYAEIVSDILDVELTPLNVAYLEVCADRKISAAASRVSRYRRRRADADFSRRRGLARGAPINFK